MVSDVLFARLSGNEERVLCGVLDCGARIADIYRPTPYDIEEVLEAGEEALPNLYFPPGWARREDGVWTLARYAMKRHRRGSPDQRQLFLPPNDNYFCLFSSCW